MTTRREVSDRHGEAWTLAGSGFPAIGQGRLGHAHRYASQALGLFTEVGDLNGKVSALFTLAEALCALEKSLAIFKEISNRDGEALVLAKTADVHLALGQYGEALSYLGGSLTVERRTRCSVGDVFGGNRGRKPRRARGWEAALELCAEVDDPRASGIQRTCQRAATSARLVREGP